MDKRLGFCAEQNGMTGIKDLLGKKSGGVKPTEDETQTFETANGVNNYAQNKQELIDEVENFSQSKQGLIDNIKALFNNFIASLEKLLSGENIEAISAIEEAEKNEAIKADETQNIEDNQVADETDEADVADTADGNQEANSTENDTKPTYQWATRVNYNKSDDKIVESRPVNNENMDEIKEEFNIKAYHDKLEFAKLYKEYAAEVVVTEHGEEILRFKDDQGRPVVDYSYGKKGTEDNTARNKYTYTYDADGSYKVDYQKQRGFYRKNSAGQNIWGGFVGEMTNNAPGYYDKDGNEINDKEKQRELDQISLGLTTMPTTPNDEEPWLFFPDRIELG